AYHPESARLARIAGAGSHVRMSWFSLGGMLVFASAPVLVAPLLAAGGLGASPWLVVPGMAGALLTLPVLRALSGGGAARGARGGGGGGAVRAVRGRGGRDRAGRQAGGTVWTGAGDAGGVRGERPGGGRG